MARQSKEPQIPGSSFFRNNSATTMILLVAREPQAEVAEARKLCFSSDFQDSCADASNSSVWEVGLADIFKLHANLLRRVASQDAMYVKLGEQLVDVVKLYSDAVDGCGPTEALETQLHSLYQAVESNVHDFVDKYGSKTCMHPAERSERTIS